MNEHEHWEELAAGYALNALEPDEAEAFTAHLSSCAHCQDVLVDHELVAAQLGTLVEDVEAPSWSSLRSRVVGDVAPVTALSEVRDRRRAPRLLSAAAGLVLLAGGSVIAWQVAQDSSPSGQQQVLASCTAQAGCHAVDLQGKATLVVSAGSVRLLSSSLKAPTPGHVYVLWQLPRGGRMTLVASLRGTAPGTVGESHALPLPYEQTTAFGLSLEPSTVVPTGPTDVIALGTA